MPQGLKSGNQRKTFPFVCFTKFFLVCSPGYVVKKDGKDYEFKTKSMPRIIFEFDKNFVMVTKYNWTKYNLYWGFEIIREIPDQRKRTKIVPFKHVET